MTRSAFSALNTGVEALQGVPESFFYGLYDEISALGLPVSDSVPLAPVAVSSASGALLSLVALLPTATSAAVTEVKQRTDGAVSWLRRSVAQTVGVAAQWLQPAY